MKLSKSKVEKFYNILFWYFPCNNVPNSWCGLTWKTLFGIICFIPLSCTIGFMVLMNFLFNFLIPDKVVDKTSNFVSKVTHKPMLYIENIYDNYLYFKYNKQVFLGLFILVGFLYLPFSKYSNNIVNVIWFIIFLISFFIGMTLILLGFAYILVTLLDKFSKIKFVSNSLNNIFKFWDVFMEKYCPLIKWKYQK